MRVLAIGLLGVLLLPDQRSAPPASEKEKASPAPPAASVREELIAEIPDEDGSAWASAVWSPDGRRLAWIGKRKERRQLLVNGQAQGGEYEEIREPEFSPGSQRCAYAVKRGQHWLMVAEGKEGPEYQDVGRPVFSPDSARLAYVARKSKEHAVVVLDGQEGPEFAAEHLLVGGDPQLPTGLAFSQDGRLAYAIRRGKKKMAVAIDGRLEPMESDDVGAIRFGAAGQILSYLAVRSKKERMVVGGQAGPEFDAVHGLDMSRDGRRSAYAARNGREWRMVIDGQAGPAFDELMTFEEPRQRRRWAEWNDLAADPADVLAALFSRDGKRVAYAGRRGKRWVMVVDGQEGAPFRSVRHPRFSVDARRLAYIAEKDKDKEAVLLDDQLGPVYDIVLVEPKYSADGLHVAYLAGKQQGLKVFEVMDGVAVREAAIEGRFWTTLGFAEEMTLTPDGRRIAYVLGRGGVRFSEGKTTRALRRVVLDGQPSRDYDAFRVTDLTFSPTAQHFAYAVHDDKKIDEQSVMVVDGQEGRRYSWIFRDRLTFSGEDAVTYLARQGRRYFRVTQLVP